MVPYAPSEILPVLVVHAADLHLDSPLLGLERREGAPVQALRGATRRALERLVDLCLEERASLLLLAGDLYDGSWKDFSTGLFFLDQMARLREAGVRVVSIQGNHDAESRLTRALRLPEHVTQLSTAAPETVVIEELGVAVHGQGYATPKTTEDLSRRYPPPVAGLVNFALLHTALDGREGHAPYAPASIDRLVDRGYDYWALGHVHRREVVREAPWVVFPGNLQGRHVKETGPKGATLVHVEGGRITRVEARALDVLRFADCVVEAHLGDGRDDVLERTRIALARARDEADGRGLGARVVVRGSTEAHRALVADPARFLAEVRALSLDVGREDVWIAKVDVETRSAVDLSALAAGDDPLAHLIAALARAGEDAETLARAAEIAGELSGRVPPEVLERAPFLRDPEALAALLAKLPDLMLARLAAGEGAEPARRARSR